ncbi:unnamed protein product, partial [Iphiclides podalirius]
MGSQRGGTFNESLPSQAGVAKTMDTVSYGTVGQRCWVCSVRNGGNGVSERTAVSNRRAVRRVGHAGCCVCRYEGSGMNAICQGTSVGSVCQTRGVSAIGCQGSGGISSGSDAEGWCGDEGRCGVSYHGGVPAHDGVEAGVSVSRVVYCAAVAVGIQQRVPAHHAVADASLLLTLHIAGVRVGHAVGEAAVFTMATASLRSRNE